MRDVIGENVYFWKIYGHLFNDVIAAQILHISVFCDIIMPKLFGRHSNYLTITSLHHTGDDVTITSNNAIKRFLPIFERVTAIDLTLGHFGLSDQLLNFQELFERK